jgi:phosphoenolpyruvate carboxykinase (ATP)
VEDLYAGASPKHRLSARIYVEYAWHALFIRHLLRKVPAAEKAAFTAGFTVVNLPSFKADPKRHGVRGETVIACNFAKKLVLIGSTSYAGETKKSVFTYLNYVMPEAGVMPMHCSAAHDDQGRSAVFFGLSGTGKTTLSADPTRRLIGDDETIWSDNGLCNLEDGCYAKLIDLNKDAEPVIWAALEKPGTIVENVPAPKGKKLADVTPHEFDLTDKSITENTRFSYPLTANPNVMPGAQGPHPQTIVLLTADAFGVLPPLAVLDGKQVMYHFVSGFTAKLAGTEVGVTEPKAAFSACFGAPFMAHKPVVYAKLLREKMEKHKARCILLNTGWSGGPYGVGKRISIKDTRALLEAALRGDFDEGKATYETHPVFNMKMPTACQGVDAKVLNPRNTWADKAAYDAQATKLRDMFRKNFEDKKFASLGIEPVM